MYVCVCVCVCVFSLNLELMITQQAAQFKLCNWDSVQFSPD